MEASRFQRDGVYNFEMTHEIKEPVKTVRVFIAAIAANLSTLAVGTSIGWFAAIIPKLHGASSIDSPLNYPIDLQHLSWIGSVMAVGAIISPFIAGLLADLLGRKKALLSSSIFFIIAHIVLLVAFDVWMIMLAHFIKGFGIGFVMSIVPMYIGEISTDNVRGALGSLMSFFTFLGIFAMQFMGPFVSYNGLQYICIAVPIVFFITFFFMPESPYFYIAKGQRNEAVEALKFLRGQTTEAVRKELSTIEIMVETSKAQKGFIIDRFTNGGNSKALITCLGLVTFHQVFGSSAVFIYSQSIVESVNIELKGSTTNIIIYAIHLISAGLTPLIADRIDPNVFLLISALSIGVCSALPGCFVFIQMELGYNLSWLPIPALVLYIIMFVVGFGAVPWIVLSEMFAPNIKSIASSMVVAQCWIAVFFIPFFYHILFSFEMYYAFWLYALLGGLAFCFIFFIVVETRGLSLQEVQNRLHKRVDTLKCRKMAVYY